MKTFIANVIAFIAAIMFSFAVIGGAVDALVMVETVCFSVIGLSLFAVSAVMRK